MLVYSATKTDFLNDVQHNRIEDEIEKEVLRKLHRNSPRSEIMSWKNSLNYMFNILVDEDIPGTAGVAIEYRIPLTNRRIDFILTGADESNNETAVIIELKQWSEVKKTQKDGVVETFINGAIREMSHPSYQAWSYAVLINDYNETVRKENIQLWPCAYLHNLKTGQIINDEFYKEHVSRAPIFTAKDTEKLSNFLKKYVKHGDQNNVMYRIEHGVIKPSKMLADCLDSMLMGNQEFTLLDEQKIVYETAIDLAYRAQEEGKKTLIVKGGPGTGKSVVAINLLVNLTSREMLCQYVTKNAAPRSVFKSKLAGTIRKTRIDNLFKGSGSYIDTERDTFDALIIDESHRLNEKGGLYGNKGDHQVKELINASKTSIFFIDEDQRVTVRDVGTVDVIRQFAEEAGSKVIETELESQFRCNGSDGYLAWIDSALQNRETANSTLEDIDYDFRVFDNPIELRKAIEVKNRTNNKSRLVAGYCWDWVSKKDPSLFDIEIPEYDFRAQWNLTKDGSLWLIAQESINEIGCIHTCQGLELDYVGVIIGDDFVIRNGIAVTQPWKRSKHDQSIKGYKKLLREDEIKAKDVTERIIKNTYRTLMTRGMKGCYIFCTDRETNEYFKSRIGHLAQETEDSINELGSTRYRVPYDLEKRSKNSVPVYDLKAAAGSFSEGQAPECIGWWALPNNRPAQADMFVAQVLGESMNLSIPNGSWCLFRANPGGTRNGKIVLVQHRDIIDPDTGGHYTIKRYRSEKSVDEGDALANKRIVLVPESKDLEYEALIFERESAEYLTVVAELHSVL